MKKLVLVLALGFIGHLAIAQNLQVQNAYNHNKSAQQYIEQAEVLRTQNRIEKADKQMKSAKAYIQKAKEAIDASVANEQTMNDAKAWHYYGVIYYKIGIYPEFSDLDQDAFQKSLDAFSKVKTLNQKYYEDNIAEISQYIKSIGSAYYDKGANNFNESNFVDATTNFKKAYDAALIIGEQDNSALENAALSSMRAGDFEKSCEYYQTLLDNGYDKAGIYQNLTIAYRNLGDNDKMLETVLKGKEKYPEDANIINEMINTYITLNREAEIIDELIAIAEKFNTEPVYYFILGTIDGNSESELFNIDEAVSYYTKAIQIDPNYENAYINIGSLYIDQAAQLYNKANDLPIEMVKEYDQLISEAKSYDEKALPYVEKSYELLPDDEAIKQALKTLYNRLKMTDKAAELNK